MAFIKPNKWLHHTHGTVKASYALFLLSEEKLAKMWNCLDSNEEPCSLHVTKKDGIARVCYKDMCFKLKVKWVNYVLSNNNIRETICSNYYTLCIKKMQQVKPLY